MFGRPALKELQEAPPFVERKTPTSVAAKSSRGSPGAGTRAVTGTSGISPETFVQLSPASAVTKTCREGAPR